MADQEHQVRAVLIIISLHIILNPLSTAASSNHIECEANLAALSLCGPFMRALPRVRVPQRCCDTISVAFNSTGSGGDSCICRILQQSKESNHSSILGLPILCKTASAELSVDCGGESVSKAEEATRRRYLVIRGNCNDQRYCKKVCEKRLPTTFYVICKVISGTHLCYCHGS